MLYNAKVQVNKRCVVLSFIIPYHMICCALLYTSYGVRLRLDLARSRSNILVLGHKILTWPEAEAKTLYKYIATSLSSDIKILTWPEAEAKTLYKYIATSLSSDIKILIWPEAEAKTLYNPSATTRAAVSQSLAIRPYCKDARARCHIMRASVSWDIAGTFLTNGSSPLSGCVQTISIRPIRKS